MVDTPDGFAFSGRILARDEGQLLFFGGDANGNQAEALYYADLSLGEPATPVQWSADEHPTQVAVYDEAGVAALVFWGDDPISNPFGNLDLVTFSQGVRAGAPVAIGDDVVRSSVQIAPDGSRAFYEDASDLAGNHAVTVDLGDPQLTPQLLMGPSVDGLQVRVGAGADGAVFVKAPAKGVGARGDGEGGVGPVGGAGPLLLLNPVDREL